ncbi:DEAD/DEAH box helicase [Sutterella megalosphaeroides]|uniref:RNA helicase n=1 Tax=Sutterella megalosphaeroides TaxID=2494234 RepID=A0A2Z6I8J6_9BURK|nr:DEAD/DEAH box helicase [Sutterella megalosphaeroides]BBF22210.1 DEAD-box ATP-dependent RNA helicase CshA [Sutterella megalosphaeroides]
MATFSELGLSDDIVSALSQLGFEEPTPIQQEAIPALLDGRDVLGQAATGTGKTAAFGLPLLDRHVVGAEPDLPLILVLTPTRELCLQVSESFHNFGRNAGIIVTPIYGGQEYGRQIRALKRGTHVVVATPGRALDHINKGTLDLSALKAIVLDEADEMLDLGFADELDAIFNAVPETVQTALFSATLAPRIARIAEEHLKDPVRIQIAREETADGEAPRVPQIAYVVGHNYRLPALGRILDLEGPELAIIFTRTRTEVDELTEALRARGWSVEALHGGLDQPTRDRVMKRARAGQVDVIVATDVAARGIDLENLTHVVNFGIPASYDTYVHRIGRTGRAGRTGTAITLLEPREHRHLRAIERITKSRIEIRSVPSATDVRAHRLEVVRGSVEEVLREGDLERFRVVVETLCEEHDPFDVAAAAIRLALESEGGVDDDTDIPAFSPFERPKRDRAERGERTERNGRERRDRSAGPEAGMKRIFFGAGRDVGVRPGDIVGAFANESGIHSRSIGAIDISDRFTLVEVEEAVAERVVEAMQGVRYKGRNVLVKFDEPRRREERSDRSDRADRGERSDRSDRADRGDRGERFERFGDRTERNERNDRYDRNDRGDRRGNGRFDRFERNGRGPRR